ncbi:uncharacterized protein LOC108587818 [Callithrix jacchus]
MLGQTIKRIHKTPTKGSVSLCYPGWSAVAIHWCDPTADQHGSFDLLHFQPGQVRLSLGGASQETPEIHNSPGVLVGHPGKFTACLGGRVSGGPPAVTEHEIPGCKLPKGRTSCLTQIIKVALEPDPPGCELLFLCLLAVYS